MESKHNVQKTNGLILSITNFLGVCVMLGYVVEGVRGERPLPVVAAIIAMTVTLLGLSTWMYYKNKDGERFRYISLIGFAILYGFCLLTSKKILVYTFIFPLFCLYVLYFDHLIMRLGSVLFIGLNIIRVIQLMFFMGYAMEDRLSEGFLQLTTVVTYCCILMWISKFWDKMNKEHTQALKGEQRKTEELLKSMIAETQVLDTNSIKVSKFVKELLSEVNQISNSVIHISSGVVATNNSIANQITKTSDIESEITHTKELAVTMQHSSQKNISVIEEGAARIEALASVANKVMDYSQDSTQTMVELKDKAGKILEIIQFIGNIAKQTNLLSLNSSIEAARAGEAGKGFAVVASEIRYLSDEINGSLKEIETVIATVEQQIDIALKKSVDLEKLNKDQAQMIYTTQKDFYEIKEESHQLNANTDTVTQSIQDILLANAAIVQQINDLSAVSEETTASTEEVSSICQQVLEASDNTKDLVEELILASNDIKKYIN